MTPADYTARKPCQTCGRTAHAGMVWCRIVGALVNGGFELLAYVVRAH